MPTDQFIVLAHERQRRLRQQRRERFTRPFGHALRGMLTLYTWAVLGAATALVVLPLALVAAVGAGIDVARGRA